VFKNFPVKKITTQQLIFIVLVVLCLTPWITPPIALLLGLMVAQFIGHPFLHLNQKATSRLLQFSVIGLGFGMNVNSALQAGKEGFLFAVASILGTLILGYFLGKMLKVEQKTSLLISSGTAICGGSAIAALSPILEAEEDQISVALGTIFILNAIALFIFPAIGHALNMTEHQFGLWCAIAIHDTSSVVGAAGKFGPHALETATTVKLSRALWIIPIALGASMLLKNDARKIKIPYFIGLFIIAMLLNSYVPGITKISSYITAIAKTGLTLTLFLIGAGLSRKVLTSVGLKPLIQGIVLWLVISSAALYAIRHFAG